MFFVFCFCFSFCFLNTWGSLALCLRTYSIEFFYLPQSDISFSPFTLLLVGLDWAFLWVGEIVFKFYFLLFLPMKLILFFLIGTISICQKKKLFMSLQITVECLNLFWLQSFWLNVFWMLRLLVGLSSHSGNLGGNLRFEMLEIILYCLFSILKLMLSVFWWTYLRVLIRTWFYLVSWKIIWLSETLILLILCFGFNFMVCQWKNLMSILWRLWAQ